MRKQIILPKLEPWQKDVFDAFEQDYRGKIFVCKARRQCGKSVLAEILLIKFALERVTTNVVVEPTMAQSRRVFKQIQNMLDGSGAIKSANSSLLIMEFVNGSEIIFKSAEQEEALRGMTVTGLLVIDEGAFIRDHIYDILFPTTDANNAPILIISTPLFEDGKFYDLFVDSDTISFDWSEYDTSKFLSPEKLEYYRKTVSPNKFKSEYLGEFITDGSYVFGNIRPCVRECNGIPKYGGIDWGTGNDGDYTVITLMDEKGNVIKVESMNNLDSTQQVSLIAQAINSNPSLLKVQVELNSIGRVFYDHLKKAVNKPAIIEGFNTTNESKRRVIEQLVTAFQTGAISIPDDAELITELQHYAVEKTAKGYTYNGVSGYHDDYVISLALAYDLIKNTNGAYAVSFKKPKKQLHIKDIQKMNDLLRKQNQSENQ